MAIQNGRTRQPEKLIKRIFRYSSRLDSILKDSGFQSATTESIIQQNKKKVDPVVEPKKPQPRTIQSETTNNEVKSLESPLARRTSLNMTAQEEQSLEKEQTSGKKRITLSSADRANQHQFKKFLTNLELIAPKQPKYIVVYGDYTNWSRRMEYADEISGGFILDGTFNQIIERDLKIPQKKHQAFPKNQDIL